MGKNLCSVCVLVVLVVGLLTHYFRASMVQSRRASTTIKKVLSLDASGAIIHENTDGQVLRMWTFVHTMEDWLLSKKEDIEIDKMYLGVQNNDMTFLRYYVLYRKTGKVEKE